MKMSVEIDGIRAEDEQAWALLEQQGRFYTGPHKLSTPPHTKPGYRGTNSSGGRKAKFQQSSWYNHFSPAKVYAAMSDKNYAIDVYKQNAWTEWLEARIQ